MKRPSHGSTGVRLDLFLKMSRLVKRRTLAHDFCERGWVEVNGSKGKPGRDVREGDRIVLHLGEHRKEVEILSIPGGNVPASEAPKLYKILSDIPEEGD